MNKKRKVFVVEIKEFGELYYYSTLSKVNANHNLGVSIHTLYKYSFDDMDFENDKCVIKKRWTR